MDLKLTEAEILTAVVQYLNEKLPGIEVTENNVCFVDEDGDVIDVWAKVSTPILSNPRKATP